MTKKKTASIWFLCALLCGCISYENLDRTAAIVENSGQAIVVIGIQPEYRVAVGKGSYDGKSFRTGTKRIDVYAAPSGGYLVQRLPATTSDERFGIVRVLSSHDFSSGVGLSPCGHASIPTFSVEPGSIVYLGDIQYEINGTLLRAKYGYNYAEASRFIDSTYPNLKGMMTKGKLELIPIIGQSCVK